MVLKWFFPLFFQNYLHPQTAMQWNKTCSSKRLCTYSYTLIFLDLPPHLPGKVLAGLHGYTWYALGIWICGCSLFYKREFWASKLAGAHSNKRLKISGCKRWYPKDLWVRAPAAPVLTHSLISWIVLSKMSLIRKICHICNLISDWLAQTRPLAGRIFQHPFFSSRLGWPISPDPKWPFSGTPTPTGYPGGGSLLPQIWPKTGYVNHAQKI